MKELPFSQIISLENIACDTHPADKSEALSIAVNLACIGTKIPWPSQLYKDVMARERLAPTGIGEGVAVPHALCDYVKETRMSILRLDKGIAFEAIDEIPVDLIFLITGPRNDYAGHLKLLSALARLLHKPDFRKGLREAEGPEAIYDLIISLD